jgi:hypothetical protein
VQLASAFTRRLGVEPQVAETGATGDEWKLDVVRRVDAAEPRMKFVKRVLQCYMLLGLETAFAEPGDGKADRGTKHHRAGKKQR